MQRTKKVSRQCRDIAYPCTEFDDCSLSRSRDMVGAHPNLNGSRDLTTPLSEMVCHPWASTCYRQPTCTSAFSSWSINQSIVV